MGGWRSATHAPYTCPRFCPVRGDADTCGRTHTHTHTHPFLLSYSLFSFSPGFLVPILPTSSSSSHSFPFFSSTSSSFNSFLFLVSPPPPFPVTFLPHHHIIAEGKKDLLETTNFLFPSPPPPLPCYSLQSSPFSSSSLLSSSVFLYVTVFF